MRRPNRFALALSVGSFWILPLGALAQSVQTWPYGDFLTCEEEFKKPPASRDKSLLSGCIDILSNRFKLSMLAAGRRGHSRLLRAVEAARLDKQAGGGPSGEGTTSLVSKGFVPQVLSVAVENGALARTNHDTVVTYRGNALGVTRLVAGAEQFPYCPIVNYACESRAARFLGGLSMPVSFDPSRTPSGSSGGNQGPVFTGTGRQIAGWGIRYDFRVRRNQLEERYREAWEKSIADPELGKRASQLLAVLSDTYEDLALSSEYQRWHADLLDRLTSPEAAGVGQSRRISLDAGRRLTDLARDRIEDFDAKIDGVLDAFGGYFGVRDRLLREAVHRITYAFEFTNSRPFNQPSQSNFRFIVSGRPTRSETSLLTANFGLTIYDSLPRGAPTGRLRDGQAALQLDRRIGRLGSSMDASLSGGYYWQYMKDDALLSIPAGDLAPGAGIPLPGDASVLLRTKGSIHIGQAKLTISIKDSGVKIPIALTWANRSELVMATEVRGNFGVTFDLDSLFMKK